MYFILILNYLCGDLSIDISVYEEVPLTVEDRHIYTFLETNENKVQLDSAQFLLNDFLYKV